MPATLRFTGDDKDLTLDELAQLVEDACKVGVPVGRNIRAELSTTGEIRAVEATLGEDD
ncbi:hypothetical protein OG458_40550 [Streptomyces sp. NBC_01281]|uniref:hypothetical protein n=1 Tax=unclassified Streptomyces TaxID=2593676 RepID=UPI00194212F3|nr:MULTISPECIES: hypothetical protein [unclassified Streptomyces]WSK65699.1 hypothetical protein OG458_40550 [Streptomyces sp. NBC_01281]